MIVVTIIGILSTIMIPKFATLVRKSQEGQTKGNLGALRSALSVYFADMAGEYPSSGSSLTINAKYLSAIPSAYRPDFHPKASGVAALSVSTAGNLETACRTFSDWAAVATSGWVFCRSGPSFTNVTHVGWYVNCSHTDTKNVAWSTY